MYLYLYLNIDPQNINYRIEFEKYVTAHHSHEVLSIEGCNINPGWMTLLSVNENLPTVLCSFHSSVQLIKELMKDE